MKFLVIYVRFLRCNIFKHHQDNLGNKQLISYTFIFQHLRLAPALLPHSCLGAFCQITPVTPRNYQARSLEMKVFVQYIRPKKKWNPTIGAVVEYVQLQCNHYPGRIQFWDSFLSKHAGNDDKPTFLFAQQTCGCISNKTPLSKTEMHRSFARGWGNRKIRKNPSGLHYYAWNGRELSDGQDRNPWPAASACQCVSRPISDFMSHQINSIKKWHASLPEHMFDAAHANITKSTCLLLNSFRFQHTRCLSAIVRALQKHWAGSIKIECTTFGGWAPLLVHIALLLRAVATR